MAGQPVRSVAVAFAVLEVVAEYQPVGVSEVARALDLPKSTAQRALVTLGQLGWIWSSDDGPNRWSLTAKAMAIGAHHRADDELRAVARSPMHTLSATTGETVHLSVPEDRFVVLIDKVEGVHPVRTNTYIGGRAPVHAVATGKALLAAMPGGQAEALLRAAPLEALTEQTETDPDVLLRELEDIRHRGYAVAMGTRHVEIGAVAAAVLTVGGRPVAALSLSLPIHRLPAGSWLHFGRQVAAAAADCSTRLDGRDGDAPRSRTLGTARVDSDGARRAAAAGG